MAMISRRRFMRLFGGCGAAAAVAFMACLAEGQADGGKPIALASASTGAGAGRSCIISLSGSDWRLHDDADGKGADLGLALADPSGPGWIPASVPGNVQADLEAAHQLMPLWYGAGDPRMHEATRKDWWYRKDFEVPADLAGRRVRLAFDGVDHECEVWLNGRRIGRNAGMFRRFGFDVADGLKFGQKNRLAVRISRIPAPLAPLVIAADAPGGGRVGDAVHKTRAFLKELKSPTNAGWDWAVAVYTLGIWKDVWLEATGPARIQWVRVRTDLMDHYSKASVKVGLNIDSQADMKAKVSLRAAHKQSAAVRTIDVALKKGANAIEVEMPLDQPALWWPNGQGDQPLYELESEIREAGSDELMDRRTTRFGVREIRWEQVPGAPEDFINPLKLVVNGRPVRQMGSNMIPPDILFGRIDRRGLRLLELAQAGGINCLRIWGGGVIFSEAMYDRADELGIMFLQEFPLANGWPETDAVFLANFETTITDIVKQTRNHPCIVEWSGGNEMPWKNGTQHPALQLLEKIVREQDGRIFRATEPAQGSGRHGTYTYVYHNEPAPYLSWLGAGKSNLYQRYNTCQQMRISEFGTNSPSNLEVWHREIPPSSQWPLEDLSDPILIRKNVFHGAMLAQNWLHKEIIDGLFGPPDGLGQLVQAGQFLGAEGLRYAMDALRRKGTALGGGFMSWDYNEPWPNGAGSYMIDYDGRPLMNYDFVRQALAPISLTLEYDSLLYDPSAGMKVELCLTSDAALAADKLRWRWLARDRRGQVFARGEGTAAIKCQEVQRLAALELKPPAQTALGPIFVELQLWDGSGRLLAERVHVFSARGMRGPLGGLLKNRRQDKDDNAAGVKDQKGESAGGAVSTGLAEVSPPVRRTSLTVTARPVRMDAGQEILELAVTNGGRMTALFCQGHPLIDYRTDLFIDNNNCFIPPGESRVITVRAATGSDHLSLEQTGWWVSAFNADDQVIEPGAGLLLALGRRDAMCREFAGYNDPKGLSDAGSAALLGHRPQSGGVPCLLKAKAAVRCKFSLEDGAAPGGARLRVHTADQSAKVATELAVTVNGRVSVVTLPMGLGMQDRDPAHLAFPATAQVNLPPGILRAGENELEIRVANDGWFTWDAIDLTAR